MKQYIVLIVAVLAGLLAAVLTHTYLSTKEAEYGRIKAAFAKSHQTMEALCFDKDVPSGTVIRKADLGVKTVPQSGLRGHALEAAHVEEIVGRKLVTARRRGEPLFWSDSEAATRSAAVLRRTSAARCAPSPSTPPAPRPSPAW